MPTDPKQQLHDRVWQYLIDHRYGPSISLAGISNGVGGSMGDVREAVDRLEETGRIVVTRYDGAPWSHRAVDPPQLEQERPSRWIVRAEYDGDTIITGPYAHPEAQRVRDYAMRSDAPMGLCDVTIELLDSAFEVPNDG